MLARLLPRVGEAAAALTHARAALELRPFDPEFLRTLADAERAAARAGGRAARDDDGAPPPTTPPPPPLSPCAEAAPWVPPEAPAALALPDGCPAPGSGGAAPAEELLINPFEEGCFHDEYLDASGANKQRQEYHSCGQFNNVLASLLHGLALSRVLCRTLVLPGFFVRFGARLTRVSNFDERWLPTSHFFDLERLQASFHVREPAVEGAPPRKVRQLLARAEGSRAPQLRFFSYLNVSFGRYLDVKSSRWPHFMQQQSELRWVADAPPHGGAFSPFDPAYPLRFWREFASTAAGREKVLAFDAQPSFGMAMDHLRWDDALRWTRGHLRYVDAARSEAAAWRRAVFGSDDAPYLAVHIRRGADRLHDFCHTDWGQKCYGWNITLAMCYPPTEAVAAQIDAARRRWKVPRKNVFLATDSPDPALFEDVLRRDHGIAFARYGQKGPKTLASEFALPVDQLLCADAPYFLGNVPSTVTSTIVQERDNRGWARENTDFFGFEAEGLRQFREGWAPTRAFAEEACV